MLFCFTMISVFAQTWKAVDLRKTINEPKIAAASDGSVYIAGSVYGKTQAVVLSKYDGKELKTLFQPDFIKIQSDVSIIVDGTDAPVVSYVESDIAVVKRFDGKTMVDVSNASPAPKGFNYLKLYADRSGVPHVFYTSNGFMYAKKLVSGVWEQILEAKGGGDFRVVFSSQNVPYILMKDKKSVKKIVDGTLIDAAPQFSSGSIYEFNLAIDQKDTLYVSYGDFSTGDLKVVKLKNEKWSFLPDPAPDFAGKGGELPVMAFDTDNTLYFTSSFRSAGDIKTIARKFQGGKWSAFQTGIDSEDLKTYGGVKQLSMSRNNTLYLNRPFYSVKVK
jgi:hypothetical protein